MCKKYPFSLLAYMPRSIPLKSKHDCCWSGCFLVTALCQHLPSVCSGICLNEGCVLLVIGYLYILPVISYPYLQSSHLPQRIHLLGKCEVCRAAKFSALMPKRNNLLKLSLSSFFISKFSRWFFTLTTQRALQWPWKCPSNFNSLCIRSLPWVMFI